MGRIGPRNRPGAQRGFDEAEPTPAPVGMAPPAMQAPVMQAPPVPEYSPPAMQAPDIPDYAGLNPYGDYADIGSSPAAAYREFMDFTPDMGNFRNGGVTRYNQGGLGSLGGYSDGGRLLRGPGDGVSDSIPAEINGRNGRQPARLADGEFVFPARIVSEIGNGSTEAGARKLYAIMDRIQKDRNRTVGRGRVAKNTRADRHFKGIA